MKKKRVLLGMSGGVDSSVAAYLLKKRGYDVIGITMQLLPEEEERKSACCNLGAVEDAKRVAQHLNIPHYVLNSRAPFQKYVIDDFIKQYASGYTPNPCVECNRYIKFDELWKLATELNGDYVATGHYCKITRSPKTGKYFLKMADDPSKDQSYFLYMLGQEKLQKTLFPLSRYTKTQIREIALSKNLINAKKAESQEVCFVSQKSYKTYVKDRLSESQVKTGPIVNLKGEKIGEHQGIFQYTIGQKRGLNLSFPYPLFVLKIDPHTHTITVGDRDALKISEIYLHTYTQIDEGEDPISKVFSIKTRYQMMPAQAQVLSRGKGVLSLKVSVPLTQVAPGQSCVLYDKDRVVGGGIIHVPNTPA